MPLYHVRVFMPATLNLPKGQFTLEYTLHAMRASMSDRYGKLPILKELNTYQYRVIEVETDDNNEVVKVLYKRKFDRDSDIVLAVKPEKNKMVVKTVWMNVNTDYHHTLDTTKYTKK